MIKQLTTIILTYSFIFFVLIFSCNNIAKDVTQNSKTSLNSNIEKKVDSVLGLMQLNEKIGQLVQYSGKWNATGPSSS